jgi:hypothetical protein
MSVRKLGREHIEESETDLHRRQHYGCTKRNDQRKERHKDLRYVIVKVYAPSSRKESIEEKGGMAKHVSNCILLVPKRVHRL